MDINDLKKEEERIIAEYNDRYKPGPYRQAFYPPPGADWKVEALYVDSFFEDARLILDGIVAGSLPEGIHGVAAVFLCRHYLELAIKYALFHSRWLQSEGTNAPDEQIEPIETGKKGHHLKHLWDKLMEELERRVPSILATGLDLAFVAKFVAEFDRIDQEGMRFRYPTKVIAVARDKRVRPSALGVDFEALLFDLTRAHDVLDTLDGRLIDQHGENEDWETEMNSW